MTFGTKQRKVLVAFVVALAAAVLVYTVTARERSSDGSAGANSLDERWDPTGSHPLPNEGVQRAP